MCTTELGYMAGLKPGFDKRNTKIIGLSVDPVENHAKWAQDIEETQGHAVNYPMIGDPDLKVAMACDMLPEGASTTSDGRTAADDATVRSVFVIGPDKKVQAMLTYPMTTGRNFDEVLRLIGSCQLTAKHTVATPVNWQPGQDVIIPPAVSNGFQRSRRGEVPERLEDAEVLPSGGRATELTTGGDRGAHGLPGLRVDLHQLGMGPFDCFFRGHALHRLRVHVDDDELADRLGRGTAGRSGVAGEMSAFRRGAERCHDRIHLHIGSSSHILVVPVENPCCDVNHSP